MPTDPVAAAERFLGAVAWGEPEVIWELLSPAGRVLVVEVAVAAGLDSVAAARLREGTAPPAERRRFLVDLLRGMRVDLAEVDLDQAVCVPVSPAEGPPGMDVPDVAGVLQVRIDTPTAPALGGSLPVGDMWLSCRDGRWGVDRLRLRSWGADA